MNTIKFAQNLIYIHSKYAYNNCFISSHKLLIRKLTLKKNYIIKG
jgi:hypothetical protein